MLDIAAFTGALTTIGSLMKIANESKNVPMTDKLIELQQKLLAMQGDFGELQQKLFEVQQENRELTEGIARKNRYEHRFSTLWRVDEKGNTLGPYCPICHADGKELALKPLNHAPANEAQTLAMTCPVLHMDGRMQRPIYYMIPREVIPENWICPE
jgi:hypothetical protein